MTTLVNKRSLALFLLVLAGLVYSKFTPKLVPFRGETFGTTYTIKVVTRFPKRVIELNPKLTEEFKRLDAIFSTYSASELATLNAAPKGQYSLSDELYNVLSQTHSIQAKTNGAYDVTIEPLFELWGFKDTVVEPDAAQLASVPVGRAHYTISANKLEKHTAGLQFDLSSIAKGYAIDRIVALLEDAGYTRYLVEFGGELRGRGRSHHNKPWRIAVESPDRQRNYQKQLILENKAIATSGTYRRVARIGPRRVSHIIDPATRRPVAHNTVSVSVLAPSAALADAWATALLVMGMETGYDLVSQTPDIDAYFIWQNGDTVGDRMTEGFENAAR